MEGSYFKDRVMNRDPHAPMPIKEFKHGQRQTITREPLPKRANSGKFASAKGFSKAGHTYRFEDK